MYHYQRGRRYGSHLRVVSLVSILTRSLKRDLTIVITLRNLIPKEEGTLILILTSDIVVNESARRITMGTGRQTITTHR